MGGVWRQDPPPPRARGRDMNPAQSWNGTWPYSPISTSACLARLPAVILLGEGEWGLGIPVFPEGFYPLQSIKNLEFMEDQQAASREKTSR